MKKKLIKYIRRTLANKLLAILIASVGVASVYLTEGDATACIFLLMIAIPLFLAKDNWIV